MKLLYAIAVSVLLVSAALAVQVLIQNNGVNVQGNGVVFGLAQSVTNWTPDLAANTLLQWFRSDDLLQPAGSSISNWPAHVAGNPGVNPGGFYAPTMRIFGGASWQRYAEFDGIANYIQTGDWASHSYTTPFVWALAFKKRGSLNELQIPMSSNNNTNESLFSYIVDDNVTYDMFAGFLNGSGPSSTDQSSWHTLVVQWNPLGISPAYSMDGAPMTPTPQDINDIPLWGIVLGMHGDLIDYPGTYNIGECIVWSGTLNATDFQGLTNYFGGRWH